MRKMINGYYRLLRVLLASLMGLLMIPVAIQIFSRYIGLIPRYIWTEEMARFCFIWIILIGSMIAVRDGTHFAVDLLPQPKTKRGEPVCGFLHISGGDDFHHLGLAPGEIRFAAGIGDGGAAHGIYLHGLAHNRINVAVVFRRKAGRQHQIMAE